MEGTEVAPKAVVESSKRLRWQVPTRGEEEGRRNQSLREQIRGKGQHCSQEGRERRKVDAQGEAQG
jgi:hypothetical protein